MNSEERELVSAAAIARRLGVGRAAVANWRTRHPDFPAPTEAGPSPLFSWPAVERWTVATGKAAQLASAGRTTTGTQRIGDVPGAPAEVDRDLAALTPRELLARVMASLLPRLGDGDPPPDDEEPPVVFDPACTDAALLTAVVERFGDHVRLAGQAPDDAAARAVRQALPSADTDVRTGDALAKDRFATTRGTARAVLCVPPSAVRQWPAADLAADPRWKLGLPDAGDPELAWVEHCLAHLRRRGVAVVVMSPVTGVRPSGRHVRAALVRSGYLRDVITLPVGLSPTGDGAAQLWVLRRGRRGDCVRMVDLAPLPDVLDVPRDHSAWEALFETEDSSVVREVPPLELLDGDVPLVPSRYLSARSDASVAGLAQVTRRLAHLYTEVGELLPQPVATSTPVRHPAVTLGELERARAITILPRDATPRAGDVLFRTMGRPPVVAAGVPEDERGVAQVVAVDSDRLDPWFVTLFVRADASATPTGNTLTALTRDDVRRCRIPRLPLDEQRRHGDELRRLEELDALAQRLAAATSAVVAQTVHGLTSGALLPGRHGPPATSVRESIDPEPENEKSET